MERIEQIYDKIILAQIGFTVGRMSEFELYRARREPVHGLDMQWATGNELDLIARHVLSRADYAYWRSWVDSDGVLPVDLP